MLVPPATVRAAGTRNPRVASRVGPDVSGEVQAGVAPRTENIKITIVRLLEQKQEPELPWEGMEEAGVGKVGGKARTLCEHSPPAPPPPRRGPGPRGFPPPWRLTKGRFLGQWFLWPPPCPPPRNEARSGRQLLGLPVCRGDGRGKRGLGGAWGARPSGAWSCPAGRLGALARPSRDHRDPHRTHRHKTARKVRSSDG